MSNERKGHDAHVIFIAPGVGTVTIDGLPLTCKNVRLSAGARKQTELTVTILINQLNVPAPMPGFGQPPAQAPEAPASASQPTGQGPTPDPRFTTPQEGKS